jgi:hypothetical protein
MQADSDSVTGQVSGHIVSTDTIVPKQATWLDTLAFNNLQLHLVHNQPGNKWPVKTSYPLAGAVLPFKRVVAYYGNFYSRGMGILGELSEAEVTEQLLREVHRWTEADSLIPAIPAIHYIAVTAQRNAGKDGMYRLRMPAHQIDKALALARSMNALLFLDIQVGHSSLNKELPPLVEYLKQPDVHLGIDPEYSMKGGEVPCTRIGTFDATDINDAVLYLSALVKEYKLPPKILVVHRFTKQMVTNYRNVLLTPEVQIVMHMDGFGFPAKKIDSYNMAIRNEPVQYTGFKIFYKNDKLSVPYRLMTPEEILGLYPSPVYIQYQ